METKCEIAWNNQECDPSNRDEISIDDMEVCEDIPLFDDVPQRLDGDGEGKEERHNP